MLFRGEGVAKDEKRAAQLFRLAAEKGNPVAQNRLARLYANVVVFEPDTVRAAKWHLLARQAGVSDFSLDIMLAKLSKEERVEAERLVDAWESGRLTD
jgi:TPR repeat protein